MATSEPLTEQAVVSMLKALDRYESYVTMFSYTMKEPAVNDALNELMSRLPGLFVPPISLETQQGIITLLMQYVLNPLNNRKMCQQLFDGMVQTFSGLTATEKNSAAKLAVVAMVSPGTRQENRQRQLSAAKYSAVVLTLMDVKTVGEILQTVLGALNRISSKRNRDGTNRTSVVEDLQSLLLEILSPQTAPAPAAFLVREISRLVPAKSWRSYPILYKAAPFFERFDRFLDLVHIRHRDLFFPIVGYTWFTHNLWNLDRVTLHFTFPDICDLGADRQKRKQSGMIQYLIEQAHSRHSYQTILGVSKSSPALSSGLEDQIVAVMARHLQDTDEERLFVNWLHIFNQTVTAVSCGFCRLGAVVERLIEALRNVSISAIIVGRFYCIWVFYQLVAVQSSNEISNFTVSLLLLLEMFPDQEYLGVPAFDSKYDIVRLSPAYLYAHVVRRAQLEKVPLPCGTPLCITSLMDYLRKVIDKVAVSSGLNFLQLNFEHISAVNAFVSTLATKDPAPTRMDYTDKMVSSLTEHLVEGPSPASANESMMAPGGCAVFRATKPLTLDNLDGISSHIRIGLSGTFQTLFNRSVSNYASNPACLFFSSAFWETIGHMMLYEETETNLLAFLIRRLPEIIVSHRAWFVLAGELELLAFRIPHIPLNWKPNVLVMIMSVQSRLSAPPYHPQILSYLDQVLLRAMQSFNMDDMNQPRTFFYESKVFLASDAEEIVRLALLTMIRLSCVFGLDAQTLHVVTSHIAAVQQTLPHTWNPNLLAALPEPISILYRNTPNPPRDKTTTRRVLEDVNQRLRAATTDAEIRSILNAPQPVPIWYCVIWRQLMENTDPSVPFRAPNMMSGVLERLAAKGQMQSLRVLLDYIIHDLTSAGHQVSMERIHRLCDCLRQMIWKFGIFPMDRVIFVLVFRPFENVTEAQMALYMIVCLCKTQDFQSRLTETLQQLPADYWNHQETFFEKLVAYHQMYPETFYFNGNYDFTQSGSVNHERLPLYFSNVVLRCLPIFDLVIQRYIELPKSANNLDLFLDNVGKVFKYHDRPVNFIWQTLSFYDNFLLNNYITRRKLVRVVIGCKAEIYPPNFYFTTFFENYLATASLDAYVFPPEYFDFITERLRMCLYSHNLESPYPHFEWRYHEFANAAPHALYTGSVELICIASGPDVVVNGLLDVLRRRFPAGGTAATLEEDWKDFQQRLNTVAHFLSALPDRFFAVILKLVKITLEDPELVRSDDLFDLLDLRKRFLSCTLAMHSLVLQVVHGVVLQNGMAHLLRLLENFQTILIPLVTSEVQLVFVLSLFTPLLGKLVKDHVRLNRLVMGLLELVQRVGSAAKESVFASYVMDVLSYIFQTFPVPMDSAKLDEMATGLQPEYARRLRFLPQLWVADADGQ